MLDKDDAQQEQEMLGQCVINTGAASEYGDMHIVQQIRMGRTRKVEAWMQNPTTAQSLLTLAMGFRIALALMVIRY